MIKLTLKKITPMQWEINLIMEPLGFNIMRLTFFSTQYKCLYILFMHDYTAFFYFRKSPFQWDHHIGGELKSVIIIIKKRQPRVVAANIVRDFFYICVISLLCFNVTLMWFTLLLIFLVTQHAWCVSGPMISCFTETSLSLNTKPTTHSSAV